MVIPLTHSLFLEKFLWDMIQHNGLKLVKRLHIKTVVTAFMYLTQIGAASEPTCAIYNIDENPLIIWVTDIIADYFLIHGLLLIGSGSLVA
jgi:hypothetical protein